MQGQRWGESSRIRKQDDQQRGGEQGMRNSWGWYFRIKVTNQEREGAGNRPRAKESSNCAAAGVWSEDQIDVLLPLEYLGILAGHRTKSKGSLVLQDSWEAGQGGSTQRQP